MDSSNTKWRSAVAEGMAVLVGILVAFSIDAGWDHRQDQIRERNYLTALLAEVEANQDAYRTNLDAVTQRMRIIRDDLETLSSEATDQVSIEAIHKLLFDMYPYAVLEPQRAAFDDLVGSGGFELIQSDTLRRALTGYSQRLEVDALYQRRTFDFWEARFSPYVHEFGSLQNVSFQGGMLGEDIPVPDLPGEPDPTAFIRNRELSNIVMSFLLRMQGIRNNHELLLLHIGATLQLLREELT
jgi:hypothetical protein